MTRGIMEVHSKIIVKFRWLVFRVIKESFKGLVKMAKERKYKEH